MLIILDRHTFFSCNLLRMRLVGINNGGSNAMRITERRETDGKFVPILSQINAAQQWRSQE